MKIINLIFCVILISSYPAFAVQDLGLHGETYKIVENDFYEWLMSKVREKQHKVPGFSQEELSKIVQRKMDVRGFEYIPSCQDFSVKTINPTYILDKNITDSGGNVLYSKGTTVNPLNYMTLKRNYMFLDVNSPAQLKLYITLARESVVQPIAVKGNLQSFYEISQKNNLNSPAGAATKPMIEKFQISCLPILIQQDGKNLIQKSFNVGDAR